MHVCSVGASCLSCVPGWWLPSPVMWHSTHLHQPFAPSVPCLLCNFCPLQGGEYVSAFSYWLFWAWISLSFCCVKRLIFLNDAFELYSNRSFKSSVKPFRVTFLVSGQWCPWPPETSHSVNSLWWTNLVFLMANVASAHWISVQSGNSCVPSQADRCCLAAAEEEGRSSLSSKALFLYQNALSVGLWRSFCSQAAVPSSSVKKITRFGIWATNRVGMWCLVCTLESNTFPHPV